MGYNFKKTFRKPKEKFTGRKSSGHLCKRSWGNPHSSKPCLALNKKNNTWEKMRYFAKMCRIRIQHRLRKSDNHNNFCEEEGRLSAQTSSKTEMGLYYTQKKMINLSTACEYVTVKHQKQKCKMIPVLIILLEYRSNYRLKLSEN